MFALQTPGRDFIRDVFAALTEYKFREGGKDHKRRKTTVSGLKNLRKTEKTIERQPEYGRGMKRVYHRQKLRSLVIVTVRTMAAAVTDKAKSMGFKSRYLVRLVFMDEGVTQTVEGAENDVKIAASGDEVMEYICREWVDEVLIALPDGSLFPNAFYRCLIEMGVIVHVWAFQEEMPKDRRRKKTGRGCTIVSSVVYRRSFRQMACKRMLDLAGGAAGCLLTAVFTVLIGPVIFLSSPGPIFFAQTRVGKNGKPFRMYKFRSMYPDAEKQKRELLEKNQITGGMMFKMDDDPRIIGGGRGIGGFIRRYSIDEFPQFWNVLKGDMSLVGSRPPTVDEWMKYEGRHRTRLADKPGITGLWQISGRSKIKDFEEVVRLDKEYIENWSVKEDIKILFKTVKVVLKKDGAW